MEVRCPICGVVIDNNNSYGVSLVSTEDGTFTMGYNCQVCFCAVTVASAAEFWSKDDSERKKIRGEFIEGYVRELDEMYKEACDEIQREG